MAGSDSTTKKKNPVEENEISNNDARMHPERSDTKQGYKGWAKYIFSMNDRVHKRTIKKKQPTK